MSEREFSVKSFHDFISEGKIMGVKCKSCGTTSLPPRPICPKCGARNLEWAELAGEGTIQTYTVINVPLTHMKDKSPYAVGIIKLDAGPSISCPIRDGSEQNLTVGARVKAEFVQEGERTTLHFRRN